MSEERLARAERTGELVLLPPVLDCLPDGELNRDLYRLAGGLSRRRPSPPAPTERSAAPGRRALRRSLEPTDRVLAASPGLRLRHAPAGRRPAGAAAGPPSARHSRPRSRPWCWRLHGAADAPPAVLWTPRPACRSRGARAPRGYRPFLPCPLWGEVRRDSAASRGRGARRERRAATPRPRTRSASKRRAKRQDPEDGEPRDPLTLINKGEYCCSRPRWSTSIAPTTTRTRTPRAAPPRTWTS